MSLFKKRNTFELSGGLKDFLRKKLPPGSADQVIELLQAHPCEWRFPKSRKTKLGDYRRRRGQQLPQLTVNQDLPPRLFLVTLIHELAHLVVYEQHTWRSIAPHGKEWKNTYRSLLQPFLTHQVFGDDLAAAQAHIAKAPASIHHRDPLYPLLPQLSTHEFDALVMELESGSCFETFNGRRFKLGQKRRTRYLCEDLDNGRQYLVHEKVAIKRLA